MQQPELHLPQSETLAAGKKLKIQSEKEFPLIDTAHAFVLLNLSNKNRIPSSDRPAFRIYGLYGSRQDAANDANLEIDNVISEVHKPLAVLRSTKTDPAAENARISEAQGRQKQEMERKRKQVEDRAAIARYNSTQSIKNNIAANGGGTVEEKEDQPPEMPSLMEIQPPPEESSPLDAIVDVTPIENDCPRVVPPTGQRFAVISIMDCDHQEPILTVYGGFDDEISANAYCANVLCGKYDQDFEVVHAGTWYAFDIFSVTIPSNTQYSDSGLNELMKIPQRNSRKREELRPYFDAFEQIKSSQDETTKQETEAENES